MTLRNKIDSIVQTGRSLLRSMQAVLNGWRPLGLCHHCLGFVFESERALDADRRIVHNLCQQKHLRNLADPARYVRLDMFETVAHPFDRIFGKDIRPLTEKILDKTMDRIGAEQWLADLEQKLDTYETDDLRRHKAKAARHAVALAREYLPSLALIAA